MTTATTKQKKAIELRSLRKRAYLKTRTLKTSAPNNMKKIDNFNCATAKTKKYTVTKDNKEKPRNAKNKAGKKGTE